MQRTIDSPDSALKLRFNLNLKKDKRALSPHQAKSMPGPAVQQPTKRAPEVRMAVPRLGSAVQAWRWLSPGRALRIARRLDPTNAPGPSRAASPPPSRDRP